MWFFSGFGLFNKLLYLKNGSDYLHSFSPYSFGGIKKSDFLRLYKNSEYGNPVKNKELYKAKYQAMSYTQISRKKFLEVNERSRIAYQYFLSPWQKNYNYR